MKTFNGVKFGSAIRGGRLEFVEGCKTIHIRVISAYSGAEAECAITPSTARRIAKALLIAADALEAEARSPDALSTVTISEVPE